MTHEGHVVSGIQRKEAEMTAVKDLVSRPGTSGKLLSLLWHKKLWWLIPMMVILTLFGLLLLRVEILR